MTESRRLDLAHDLILPTLLFAALGGMTWAVRGSSGFGTVWGCVFAGVMWGVAWWYLAREPSAEQSRRYASGWVVLAITLGVGLARISHHAGGALGGGAGFELIGYHAAGSRRWVWAASGQFRAWRWVAPGR